MCVITLVMMCDQFGCASLTKPEENIEKKSDVQTYVIEPSNDDGQIDDTLTSTDIPSIDVSEEEVKETPTPTDVSIISFATHTYILLSTENLFGRENQHLKRQHIFVQRTFFYFLAKIVN